MRHYISAALTERLSTLPVLGPRTICLFDQLYEVQHRAVVDLLPQLEHASRAGGDYRLSLRLQKIFCTVQQQVF